MKVSKMILTALVLSTLVGCSNPTMPTPIPTDSSTPAIEYVDVVKSITLSAPILKVATTDTVTLSADIKYEAVPKDLASTSITWTVISGSGTVSEGVVSANGSGDTVITATQDGITSNPITITFAQKYTVTYKFNPGWFTTATCELGSEIDFEFTIKECLFEGDPLMSTSNFWFFQDNGGEGANEILPGKNWILDTAATINLMSNFDIVVTLSQN
jgi:hypothetical protein